MDLEQLTNFRELISSVEPRLVAPFILGAIYGALVGVGFAKQWWWLVVLVVGLPLALFLAGMFLPVGIGPTYRLFFLGVVTLAVLGFAWYLRR